jgi:hypothetical protein
MPGRIYSSSPAPSGSSLDGLSLISILFDQSLNWKFVVNSPLSSSQIFGWIPYLITNALGITSDSVKTFALQVYVPSSYQTASDVADLGTMWLGYIPTEQVDALAAMIKAKQSKFYTGSTVQVATELANHVNSGFPLLSVASTSGSGSSPAGPDGGSGDTVGAAGDSGKSRQDAIIGVVSALGGIALLVLVFLVYRSLKRRKQLAHHRLSDPAGMDAATMAGIRPEGRDFDEDSVGGQRRRSFYFAEDSLRGYQGERNEDVAYGHSPQMSQQGMTQRRPIVGGAISAPVLRESSMNW